MMFLGALLAENNGFSNIGLVKMMVSKVWDNFELPRKDTDDAKETQEKILTQEWMCTPVLAPSFQNLARAHIVTAEFDLERDEGEFYGRLLKDAGNQVTIKRYTGMPHAFAHYNHPERGLSQSFTYIEDTSRLLKEVHCEVAS